MNPSQSAGGAREETSQPPVRPLSGAMTLDEWVQHCRRDAERRGLFELVPLLGTLAEATRTLRAGDWHDDPTGGGTGHELRSTSGGDSA